MINQATGAPRLKGYEIAYPADWRPTFPAPGSLSFPMGRGRCDKRSRTLWRNAQR